MMNRKNEIKDIHDEIFKTTTEHKYYCLGLAQGLSLIYDFMNEYENRNFTTKEWKETIKYVALNHEDIKDYFVRITNIDGVKNES